MNPIPEEETPDLFDVPPGPAPVQYDLFTEDGQVTAVAVQAAAQQTSPTFSVDTPTTGR